MSLGNLKSFMKLMLRNRKRMCSKSRKQASIKETIKIKKVRTLIKKSILKSISNLFIIYISQERRP